MTKMISKNLSIQKLSSYLRLARTDGIGAIRFHQLLKKYHTPDAALDILPSLLRNKKNSTYFSPPPLSIIIEEIEKTFELQGQFLIHGFDDYPALLTQLDDAPPVLTVLGNAGFLHQQNIAIVGARNASMHGIRIAESLAADLAAHSIGVTSGLARGIDQAAHKGALYTGFTIAAIACGIDIVYPTEHEKLQKQIADKGVIISEFPFGTSPQATHFPRRNRLIAGLCHGCVVIEAALNSGSLITSKLALNYNKPIFAVPGSPLDPRCKGSNNLIRMGAVLTESALDIIPELSPFITNNHKPFKPDLFTDIEPSIATIDKQSMDTIQETTCNSIEDEIIALLSTTPIPIDLIIRHLSYSATEILSTITLLEINNKIIFQHNGYILTS
ncbi:DNA-processing protein DprA [Commensalibacter communis]|uniref:Predicted Rossmann fold nucleotide-binding protein DprA/Smf involved in DNA uptake (Smf) n=1 Tax=Commensalibacter communis TaxID=2972786 RepID=A0A9W4TMQ1_9PROT|nr:DNA-processing protein DprA [Commensalibacter communis]CAI3926225.1 Predicted Rossmann fold nucleotide-binding protein DprA/Smf involved in DNA uptake (Smf) (PDB:3MAJ) [Commensalibacter communis]CAI3926943.1 Predicted Rossmann fold nucleotide-binding protein DprA/Smf involved in DNA uptake (Smf) (PDB:3MAJ) [Commensalibacter communis]CAI3927740.1 Predicted Rossmann fold nucleotide-binding protein DprA/Smf involved in DNA uptake (Smf) (PDB:3MAJ) [Commensalibacter communis]CAI3927755.1 Predicte